MAAHPAPAESTLVLRPDVVATVLHDGAVLLDLETKFFYSLNASGWAIAQQFEDGATVAQVHRRCLSLGADPSDLPAVDALIESLTGHGLLDAGGTPIGSAAAAAPAHPAAKWAAPTILKHAQPLQRVMVTAFDPGVPFTE